MKQVFFSEDIREVFSIIKKNKLVITDIEYDKKFEGVYQKIINIINLDNLIKKLFLKMGKKIWLLLRLFVNGLIQNQIKK